MSYDTQVTHGSRAVVVHWDDAMERQMAWTLYAVSPEEWTEVRPAASAEEALAWLSDAHVEGRA